MCSPFLILNSIPFNKVIIFSSDLIILILDFGLSSNIAFGFSLLSLPLTFNLIFSSSFLLKLKLFSSILFSTPKSTLSMIIAYSLS